MSNYFEGEIAITEKELNLDATLLGGQSFRWRKVNSIESQYPQWCGVAGNVYWILTQKANLISYKAYPVKQEQLLSKTLYSGHHHKWLEDYLRSEFDLCKHIALWQKAHEHFASITPRLKAVRLLKQEPLENIISFICSQNNHIKRISSMIDWFCSSYGQSLGTFFGRKEYTFPSLATLSQHKNKLETSLRAAKFGYRAKYISHVVAKVDEYGGNIWFNKLSQMSYTNARVELVKLPGIGFKVADCICLMSLGHLESVPIDTHLYKIAQTVYMPHLIMVKSITPRIYDTVAENFRSIYGPYSGWAQAVLFCSDLPQFQQNDTSDNAIQKLKKRK